MADICEAAAIMVEASFDISKSIRSASVWKENGISMDGKSISLEVHAVSIADTEFDMISAKDRKVEIAGEGDILLEWAPQLCAPSMHAASLIRLG